MFKYVYNPFSGELDRKLDTGNMTIVTSKEDFPQAVLGARNLPANSAWFISENIDLEGDRIVCDGAVTIFGESSETSFLTSTGLGAGIPLIETEYTLAMQFLSIRDVDTAFLIDGNANPPLALDWTGVNFLNIPNIGIINTCDNFIFTKGAFINSKNFIIDGNHGTVAFNQALLQGDGLVGDIIKIESTATISRRFRIIYSAIIAFGSTNALNVSTSASIPNEGYILDTLNFSGGGTYLVGVLADDNKARFDGNRGIPNSSSVANYWMRENLTATTISVIGDPVKVAGTTTNGASTQRFTHTNNRATYIGSLTQNFKVEAIVSFTTGNNQKVGIYIAKNGVPVTDSEMYATTSGSGDAESIAVQTVLELQQNDYIEVWIENTSATQNITVGFLNLIAQVSA